MRQWTMIVSAWQKMPKTFEFTKFMFRECLNEKGWSITKENLPKQIPEKAGDPTEEALLEAHVPKAEKANNHCPRCNGSWVIFHKRTTFGRFFFWFPEPRRKGARDVGNSSWLREESQMTPGEKSLCETWTRMLSVRPVMPKVKTCLSKALDQSSRGFWYFEHLNLAYRAGQMQSLTQVDGFYHTFYSTSILSTFLFIGP